MPSTPSPAASSLSAELVGVTCVDSIFFTTAALAVRCEPVATSMTLVGALCFFAGAYLLAARLDTQAA